MTRRVWIIVTAVTLTLAAIGGVAAFASGGGAEDDQDAQPSLGIPAPPGYDGVDETEVVDGSGLDIGTLPKYDGDPNDIPITDGPVEEGVLGESYGDGEGARSVDGGTVTNGELAGDEGTVSNEMPVPGLEGFVDETVVVPSEPDSFGADVDTP